VAGLSRLRGILVARSLHGRVEVALDARLGRGVRILVGPGGSVRVGRGCRVGRRARLEASGGRIELGAGSRIGERSRLVARGAPIELGEGVALGCGCTLIAHAGIAIGERGRLGDDVGVVDFEPVVADAERPIREQGVEGAPVRLGPGVRVGPRATIGPGVALAAGTQVAIGTSVRGGFAGVRSGWPAVSPLPELP
jgi:acetyltransferase-like isoleucine patch superfamily enzyme